MADYERSLSEAITTIEASEPRLIAFHVFANEDGSEATTVQLHPDAASMELHIQVVREHVTQAFWDAQGPTTGLLVYGTPGAGMLEMLRARADAGVPLIHKARHLGGFTRSSAAD